MMTNFKSSSRVNGLAASGLSVLMLLAVLSSVISMTTFVQTANAETAWSRGFIKSTQIWSDPLIPVCWENPTSSDQKERGWVYDAVKRTWMKYSKVRFTGWDKCNKDSRGIRVRIKDGGPQTVGLGNYIDGRKDGMSLNFTFGNWCTSCTKDRRHSIEVIAIHEFGHALSFAHEQNRSDTQTAICRNERSGSKGDIMVGAWDKHSVMNYCNPRWSGDGVLSTTDIQALQQFYGKPSEEEFLVKLKTNKGESGATFTEGEEVSISLQLSHPGYYYILGHSKSKNSEVSYLFSLVEDDDAPEYIGVIGKAEAGVWVDLPFSFEVAPPFGEESIQIFASSKKPSGLPSAYFDPELGLHVVSREISKGVKSNGASRAFIRKRKAKLAEAILLLKTVAKDSK